MGVWEGLSFSWLIWGVVFTNQPKVSATVHDLLLEAAGSVEEVMLPKGRLPLFGEFERGISGGL